MDYTFVLRRKYGFSPDDDLRKSRKVKNDEQLELNIMGGNWHGKKFRPRTSHIDTVGEVLWSSVP